MTANPFTPTFGVVPAHLAGRGDLLESLGRAFERGVGDPNLCSLIVGPRGSGKTALLSCAGDKARERGWIVVDVAAEQGMLEDILQHALAAAADLVQRQSTRHLTGVQLGSVLGVTWENGSQGSFNWRMRMESLLDTLADNHTGLLITVDEVRADIDEMTRLASAYQLFIRDRRDVGLVMAGLPGNVTDLVEGDSVSFLRRARKHVLKPVLDAQVERAFRRTVEEGGKSVDARALAQAVDAIQGFPYLMQLVGYCMWEEGYRSATLLPEHAQRGVRQARMEFEQGVLERTWQEMSAGDRAFVRAMLPDQMGSTLSAVARRMGKKTNYASTYKRRLMRQGVIGQRYAGTFDFDVPLFREYLEQM